MKENLEKLFQDYIDNPSLVAQQKIADFYNNVNIEKEVIEEKIKDFLKKDLPNGGIDWEIFFESNMNFWEDIYLIKQDHVAKKFHNGVLESHNDIVLLESSIDMCEIACQNTIEIKGLDKKIEDIWIKTFKEFPQFKEMLEKERVNKKKRLKKFLKV